MRHIAVMTLTSSIGLLALFLVDFVDLFFISQLGDPSLTAGMGFASTLLFLNSSLNIGLMITISALAARRIGMGRSETTKALLGEVLILGIIMSAVIAVVFWVFAPQWMTLLGATGTAHEAAVTYIRIVAPFGPVTVTGMVCSGLLRAYGDARRAMNTTLAMAAGNAIFDPILMFWLDWGFAGAAWATVISIVLMAITGIVPDHAPLWRLCAAHPRKLHRQPARHPQDHGTCGADQSGDSCRRHDRLPADRGLWRGLGCELCGHRPGHPARLLPAVFAVGVHRADRRAELRRKPDRPGSWNYRSRGAVRGRVHAGHLAGADHRQRHDRTHLRPSRRAAWT